MQIYKAWLLEKIFRVADSRTILIVAVDDAHPNYRNAQPKSVAKVSPLLLTSLKFAALC